MKTLAEQVRSELYNEFMSVVDELNGHVLREIRRWGSSDVRKTSKDSVLIEDDGSRLNERLYDAARTYYKGQGFSFRINYYSSGIIKGFTISIID